MSNRKCFIDKIRQDILDTYNQDKTSIELIKPNKMLLPINEKHPNKESTLEWAKRIANILYKKYNAKSYGPVVAIDNNSNPQGTIVDITIPSKLIDGYERKYGQQTEMFSLDTNKVNYKLKAIKALESDKVRQPKASTIQGFYNDLIKQGITNQQLDIIKDIYKDNMTKEELISSLLAEMSYTIEVNTTKEIRLFGAALEDNNFIVDNNTYQNRWNSEGIDVKFYKNGIEISNDEYTKAHEKYRPQNNTQHYSNLIVPGGTNYTENEIKTPDITPSIKGHAQFSTDNGIGWFRSDERQMMSDLQRELHTQNFTFEELVKRGEIKEVDC